MNHNNTHKEHRFAGHGAIFLCAVLWSTSGLFIRLVDWHPVVISGSRSILAAFVLLAVRFLLPGINNPALKGRGMLLLLRKCSQSLIPLITALKLARESVQKVLNPSARIKNNCDEKSIRVKSILKEAPMLAACGLCYAATMILFVIANKLTASANAILLQYAAPVWAALLGWFFLKERPHWEQWCALIFVSAGMYLVFANGLKTGSALGDMLALLSGITFGANSVVMRMRKDRNPADILIFSHIICVLFSVPFFFLYPPSLTVNNLACIVFMGIFQIGAASALFAYGIKRVPAVQAMLTAAIEPVLNPLWVLLATGERPGLSVVTGGAVILSAVMFSSVFSAVRRRTV